MPDEVLNKIKYLCKLIPKVEWSGILLYSVEGSIKEPEKMVITLKDIIPMNKGSQAYTEYNFNEKKRDTSGYLDRHIDYTNEREEALEWHLGHIHSHNTMGVFFSGTDLAELDDNSASHNFYLSLIVNNFMDFTAKVAFRAIAETQVASLPYNALDENGNSYTIDKADFRVSKEKLFMYDCDIQSSKEDIKVDELFAKNVDEIIKEADKPKTTFTTYPGNNNIPGFQQKPFPSTPVTPSTPKPNPHVIANQNAKVKVKQKPTEIIRGFVDDFPFTDIQNFFPEDNYDDVEEFVIALFSGSNSDKEINLYDIFDEIAAAKIEAPEVSKSVFEKYPALFEKFFEKEVENGDFFVEKSEEIIAFLEDYEMDYYFLSNVIMSLKHMINKFEEYDTTVR